MVDERVLAPIRRFWDKARCEAVYGRLFEASLQRLDDVTVIIGKNEGESGASAQIVVTKDDYLSWMAALEQRLKEFDAAESGETDAAPGTIHMDFGCRYMRT